ncbi:MAG: hypothetical protein AB7U83_25040 [Vicinamibacterales bacterium]
MMRATTALLVLGVLALPESARAQAASVEERAVLDVIDQFMHAVTSGDNAAMARIRLEGTTTTMERPDPAGGTTIVRRPFPAPPAPPAAPTAGSAPAPATASSMRERYWDPVVHVRGRLALVWTPYEFWRDGKTTHCGVDVFELVKQGAVWKIGNVMYTVEPDACPAMRPKDLSRVRPSP